MGNQSEGWSLIITLWYLLLKRLWSNLRILPVKPIVSILSMSSSLPNFIKRLWDVKETRMHFKWRVLDKTIISSRIDNSLILTRITWQIKKSRLIYIKQFIFFNKLKNQIKNNSFKYFTTDWQKWDRCIVICCLSFFLWFGTMFDFFNYQERHEN